MKILINTAMQRAFSLLLLIFIALIFHYPRIFFIADQSGQVTGKESLIENYSMLCNWDCGYYHYLANQSDFTQNPQFAAFFPLFPLILKISHQMFPSIQLGSLSVLVSNLFSIFAVGLCILLGSRLYPKTSDTPKTWGWNRFGLLLGLSIAVYPNSQFSSYGYPEALFLATYAGSIICLIYGNWRIAALCCSLAAITRPQGIWILGVFSILALDHFLITQSNGKRVLKALREMDSTLLEVLFIGAFPFLLFLLWQWHTFGSPFAFLKVQSTNWGRSFNFLAGIKNNIPKFDSSRIFNLLALYASFRFLRRSQPQWKMLGATTFLMTEVPLFFGGYLSYPRFSAMNLGVFIMLVEVTQNRLWWMIALLVFAITRLNVDVHNWLTSTYFMF